MTNSAQPGPVPAPKSSIQLSDPVTVNPMTFEGKWAAIGSSIGFVAGVMFAYYKKHSLWVCLGFGVLGSMLGGAVGMAIPPRKLKKAKNSLGFDEYSYDDE